MADPKDEFMKHFHKIIKGLDSDEVHAIVVTWMDKKGIGHMRGGCPKCMDDLAGYLPDDDDGEVIYEDSRTRH